MKFAPISDRLTGLGAAKWAVHVEGLRRASLGESVILLSIGEPDLPPPASVLDKAASSMRSGRTRYAAGQGEPETLLAIADHLTRRSGFRVTPEQVLFTAGTQNGLCTALLTLVQAGDEVLVPDPYYATYEGLVAASGATFVPVPTLPENNFHVTAKAIENAITSRTKVLLLNTPSNPTGAVLSVSEIDAIGEVCERHDLWIICDEVYADMTYDAPFCSPFDRPHLRDRTLAVSSISKSHALPGFRAGWVASHPDVTPRLILVAEAMLFGSQPFIEDALAVALNEKHPEVERLRVAFRERAETLIKSFEGSKAITARMPEGGMFVMLDVRKTKLTGEQFAWQLLEQENVSVMPGESFGNGGAGHIRIALTVDSVILRDACTRIRSLAEKLVEAAN
ncbi:MAG: pyridoxal phosphate-dependent aminotransferase [Acidimicrobiaceae bacterium]|nr:pyridoxal phosphate-dependent aminotransferase [Acidimicrobiaceae bacterium]